MEMHQQFLPPKKMSGNLVVGGPNLLSGYRRNASEGFAKNCFAPTSGQSRMQAAWQMNDDVGNLDNLGAWKRISNFSHAKKGTANW